MKKKIILLFGVVGAVILIIVVLLINFFNSHQPINDIDIERQKNPSDKFSSPVIFPIKNIPAKREDINSQLTLEQRKENKKLSPNEEKTIIESLASQVNIDIKKSYFDYKWGFGMVPAIREIKEDCDQALYLFTDKGKFFVKINDFSDLSRFEYEKESMLTINEAVPDFTPHPFCLGNLPKGGKFLVVNFIKARWKDRLIVKNQKSLAKSLAQLHQKKSPNGKFGFHSGKNNQWKDTWKNFFLENRWQPLWKKVLEKYPQDQELKKWGALIGEKVIPDLLGNLPTEPVLIHGNLIFDAWDYNSQTKQPWVFDTYSYYGHNEMDLSLIHYSDKEFNWVGGKIPEGCKGEFFEPEFLAEYQKYCPLPPGFEKRRDLYRLYDWIFRDVAGHPHKKFQQKVLARMKKLAQKYN